MTDKPQTHGMRVEVTGLCPFCGGQWAAGFELKDGAPAIVHSMPMCVDFERDEPQTFLQRVRTTKVALA